MRAARARKLVNQQFMIVRAILSSKGTQPYKFVPVRPFLKAKA